MEIEGALVRSLRQGIPLSISMLAERSGVSKDTIIKLELGQRNAQAETIHRLAHALNVEPRDILRKGEPCSTLS